MNTTIKLDELTNYDWKEAFSYSDGESLDKGKSFPFGIEDVKCIIRADEGENDGPNWIILVKLKNNLFGFLSAGCDYTGWDCQASGYSYVSKTKKKLIRFGMSEDDRRRLGYTLPDDFKR